MAKVKLIEVRDNIEEISKIASDTQLYLNDVRNISVSHPAGITTITYWFLRSCIDYLNANKVAGEDIEIDLMGLLNLGITYREGEAEKDANFTPYITPGAEFTTIVNSILAGQDVSEEE